MAKIKIHEADCERLIGKKHTRIHKWLNEYTKDYDPAVFLKYHRKFRHTEEAIEKQAEKWNFYEKIAAQIHLIRDYELFVLRKPMDMVTLDEVPELFKIVKKYLPSY